MVKYQLWKETVDIDIPKDVFPSKEELDALEAPFGDVEHGYIESTTGARLHYRKFLPSGKPKGLIVYQHGIQSHSGFGFELKSGRKVGFALLSESFIKEGYAFYSLDMLGHGFSEGDRWYIPDWEVNRDDLDKFGRFVAAQHDDGIPIFVSGESYGANLSLHVARKWQDAADGPKGFQGIVITAPAIEGDVPPAPVVFILRYILKPIRPRWIPFFMPNPVSADRIWKDAEVVDIACSPRFKSMRIAGNGNPFSLGTGSNLLSALEAVKESVIPGLTVPFCVCHGTEDMAVPITGTEYLIKHAKTPQEDRTFLRQVGAYHDLLADPSAEKTVAFILSHVNDRVEKAKSAANAH